MVPTSLLVCKLPILGLLLLNLKLRDLSGKQEDAGINNNCMAALQ